MKKFLTGSYIFSFAGNIITSFTGFVSIWALARILSPEELGKWLIYIAAFTFGDMMRSGVIHTALIKHCTSKNKQKVIGSAWAIGVTLSLLLLLLIWMLGFMINTYTGKYLDTELSFYLKLLMFASFPYTISLWLQQLEERFNRIMYLRLFLSVPFLLVTLSGFFFPYALISLIQLHLGTYIISSLLAVILGWSHVQSIGNANLATIKKLLSFGKYTMGTLIGTNLLKSTDTFMITWFLGPAALAAYHLPYKLIELIEIPLRSLAAIFLPQAVKQTKEHNLVVVKSLFYQYTGLLTIILIPVGLIMFFFAEEMIIVLGGATYASSANIFRCFVIYSLLLPMDRFLGMTLDILNRPHLNSVKVCLMVVINITGNLIAIHFFASPLLIAAGTIVTIAGGVIIGWLMLKRILSIQMNELLNRAYFTIGQYIHRQPKSSAA